jgi:hypothetical protein
VSPSEPAATAATGQTGTLRSAQVVWALATQPTGGEVLAVLADGTAEGEHVTPTGPAS